MKNLLSLLVLIAITICKVAGQNDSGYINFTLMFQNAKMESVSVDRTDFVKSAVEFLDRPPAIL
jgi:hypothetical protein